jgi:hypothetical protein
MQIYILYIILFIICLLLVLLYSRKPTELFYTNNKKIALCFLIYEEIFHEELWYEWLNNIDKNKYNIYIHYKNNKPLKYFDKYKIKENVNTCWGCIGLVLAQNAVLREALKDLNNQHFVFLSDSCIPFKTFNYVYNYLDINKSYFNISPDSQVFPRANNALKYIKKENLKKASMPSIINRKHAELFVNNDKNIQVWFKDMQIPDEITYISLIYHNNLQNELITTPNLAAGAIIMSQWEDMSNYKNFPNSIKTKTTPCEYKYICPEEVDYFINSTSLFGRKFLKECSGLDYLKTKII